MEKVVDIYDRFKVQWSTNDSALPDDKIRLRTIVTGISAGTEGMWFNGTAPALVSGRRSYPYTPGYELVGIVEAIGADITANPERFPRLASLKTGDRVFALKPHASIADLTEKDMWVAIPENVSNENALCLALACTCIHAAHRAHVSFGDDCAVLGLGVVGLIMLQILKSSGAGNIVASTRSPEKQDLATKFGATHIAGENAAPLCDAVFECSGTQSGLYQSTNLAANQGKIVGVGFYTEDMLLSGEQVFAKELTILGVRASGAAGDRGEFLRWPRAENLKLATKLLGNGHLEVESLISHRFKPEQLEEAYQIVQAKSEPYLLMVLDWT